MSILNYVAFKKHQQNFILISKWSAWQRLNLSYKQLFTNQAKGFKVSIVELFKLFALSFFKLSAS